MRPNPRHRRTASSLHDIRNPSNAEAHVHVAKPAKNDGASEESRGEELLGCRVPRRPGGIHGQTKGQYTSDESTDGANRALSGRATTTPRIESISMCDK